MNYTTNDRLLKRLGGIKVHFITSIYDIFSQLKTAKVISAEYKIKQTENPLQASKELFKKLPESVIPQCNILHRFILQKPLILSKYRKEEGKLLYYMNLCRVTCSRGKSTFCTKHMEIWHIISNGSPVYHSFSWSRENKLWLLTSATAVEEVGKAVVLKTVEGQLQLLKARFCRVELGWVTAQVHFLLLMRGWQRMGKSTSPHKEKPFKFPLPPLSTFQFKCTQPHTRPGRHLLATLLSKSHFLFSEKK